MNINEFINTNPELAENMQFTITLADLKRFADELNKDKEKYLTAKEMAKMLGICLTTLGYYDKRGITNPIKIGSRKIYKFTDIERFNAIEKLYKTKKR